jgi:hypothetical protein
MVSSLFPEQSSHSFEDHGLPPAYFFSLVLDPEDGGSKLSETSTD